MRVGSILEVIGNTNDFEVSTNQGIIQKQMEEQFSQSSSLGYPDSNYCCSHVYCWTYK